MPCLMRLSHAAAAHSGSHEKLDHRSFERADPVTGPDPNQMPTTAEAATLLGLKPATLANWREDGSADLAFSKFGSCVRYRYADVVAFSERTQCKSTLAARQIAARRSGCGW